MNDALNISTVVAVAGSGAMGAGIAQIAASAGHPVMLYDAHQGAAQAAVEKIQKTFAMLVEKKKMSSEDASAACARLHVAEKIDDLAGSGLVVEAIVESLDIKRQLFADLEKVVSEKCILATNTSSISVTALAAKLSLPGRFVGMHFFNPVPLMALVEVISGLATDETVARCVHATASAWGKSPVHAKSTPGFIVNRVARPFYAEALRAVYEQVASPATIDAVMREAGGFRMGPFELMDLIGNDVNFAVTKSVFHSYFNDPRFTPSLVQQELVDAGFLGRKSGRGFYSYTSDTKPIPSSEPPAAAPIEAEVVGTHPYVDVIAARARQAGATISAIKLEAVQGGWIQCGGAVLALTDGRGATQRANEEGIPNLVLFDLALDFSTATRIAVAAADQCDPRAFTAAVGFLQAAGFTVSRIEDASGMLVMRTVAMLANEAADAVNQGVCDASGADLAMQKGVNYPRGPLAWADSIGLNCIRDVLQNLSQVYGEDRYRISPLIQRKVWNGTNFH